MTIKIKDPISALTHFIGALISFFAVSLLVARASAEATTLHVIAFTMFGISLVCLYLASAIYHTIDRPKRLNGILKRIDHMMIFVLIAGTYTPVCLIPLKGMWGWTLFAIIWSVAIIGIIIKAVWINAPRMLSTGIYILMGWLVVIAFGPLLNSLSTSAFIWLLMGGVVYTLGGVIYATKWSKLNFKSFGFHDIFHLFVMGGSLCHFVLMYFYILPMSV